ncbi:orotidine-5'-phosphate decarboxylase [Thermosulfurimonas marina]|uniref:Orotidine 5'-phosphate decarboxylase n=1 Tax=Thermosulfurimonas marina TaxID=2047767 RepID=A0A6H1WUX2_9BACT|nr:orotidine-5'-phosphate decarboxylase [Thermosulfurimonas marina]
MDPASRLIFPLDVPSLSEARRWVKLLAGLVGVFKVGLELFTAEGPAAVEMVREEAGAEIFLDLKLHDIPATVAGAVRAASRLGVDMLTVHVSAGRGALKEAVRAAEGGLKILAVTLLTSLTRADLMEVGWSPELARDMREAALRLSHLAYRCGVHGVVCSAKEVSTIKEAFPHLLTVVPGVRPDWLEENLADDQRRIASPKEAVRAGADYLVVGRPIREARDPRAVAQRILEEMAQAFSEREK